jgi:fatty-acyl-CoA synthase
LISEIFPYKTLTEALLSGDGNRPFVTMWCPAQNPQTKTVTFSEFVQLARSVAVRFQERGVRQGDTVVLIMAAGIPLMAAFAGAMLLGAIPAILAFPTFKIDPGKYRQGLRGVTQNIAARLVVVDEQFPQDLKADISLNENTGLLVVSDQSLSASGKSHHPLPEISPDDVAFIQHSAGTTGLQKGVALSHRAVLNQLRCLSERLKLTKEDRIISWLPLYHDMGLIACFVLPMVLHIQVVMQAPTDWVLSPASMLHLATEYKCTLCWIPNFAFQLMARRVTAEDRTAIDLSSMRAMISCSEPVRFQAFEAFYEAFSPQGLSRASLQSSYAMAENTFAVTQTPTDGRNAARTIWVNRPMLWDQSAVEQMDPGHPDAIPLVSSGPCLKNNIVRVVNDEGVELPEGRVGEIVIYSNSIFAGYYKRPDLTRAALKDGWYSSRDRGFILNGEVFVLGRKDDTIIIGGRNLNPEDIESIVFQHPAIRPGRAVAFGTYSPEMGTEELIVIAEVTEAAQLDRFSEIERELRRLIVAEMEITPRYMCIVPPKWIIKSSAGKPARSSTRKKFLAEYVRPQTRSFNG